MFLLSLEIYFTIKLWLLAGNFDQFEVKSPFFPVKALVQPLKMLKDYLIGRDTEESMFYLHEK